MTLFKLNAGLQEQEVCKLKWDFEQSTAEGVLRIVDAILLNRRGAPSLKLGTVAHETAPNATFSLRR